MTSRAACRFCSSAELDMVLFFRGVRRWGPWRGREGGRAVVVVGSRSDNSSVNE